MIPALRRLREEDGKVELGLGSTVRSHLKPTFSPPPNLMCFRQEPALGLADCPLPIITQVLASLLPPNTILSTVTAYGAVV